ncbi:hypothetical protein A5792_29705 [Mycolicibacterium peregrinum]|uniref:Uncharacterized protein n=1 Tax=Mycolicibacterium peregrinum TaxID=43304 RepID=A0A1A0QR89_MYCPR|nr:hypothetical protein A5792_29705 [Mycolicibacterium peregrinum]
MIAGSIGWWVFDSTVLRDRRLQKDAAVIQCIDTIRDSIRQDLRSGGTNETDSNTIADGAQFSAVHGKPGPLVFDDQGVPARLGKKRSSVLTDWLIVGHVSLDSSPPFGSQLGSDNGFSCSVIVFDDNTIHVGNRQVFRA